MLVVDARSVEVVTVGQTVTYPDGESTTLLAVEPGILSATARVRTVTRDPRDNAIVTRESTVPLTVRWTHPAFFLRHVGFIPS